ncbi:MAG: glycosyltransferase [Candidatus Omnitrophica bacterium]|nr:glycosyltransferase [Candidatus Omnitrophota bacterium]
MKIPYLVNHRFSVFEGVSKKILDQVRAFQELGHKVKIFPLGKIEEGFKILSNLELINCYVNSSFKKTFFINKKLVNEVIKFNPDILYVRYDLWRRSYNLLFKKYKTIIEIQTNDLAEFKLLANQSFKKKILYLYFRIFRNRFLSNSDGFITVTKELAELSSYKKYKKPITCIPNGIFLSNYPIIKKISQSNEKVRLFFIGTSNYPWHGIDIIERIAKEIPDYEFHLVGEKKQGETLKNIIYYGELNQDNYIKILEKCQICISTLALYRKNMKEACPIKTREILGLWIPCNSWI